MAAGEPPATQSLSPVRSRASTVLIWGPIAVVKQTPVKYLSKLIKQVKTLRTSLWAVCTH